jgi:hypothetical protein
VYQLIVREGSLDGEPAPEVGGAALVQLRIPAGRTDDDPKVQFQEALGASSPTWIETRLGEAAQILRREEFVATVGPACRYCAYRTACPAQAEGEQVLS